MGLPDPQEGDLGWAATAAAAAVARKGGGGGGDGGGGMRQLEGASLGLDWLLSALADALQEPGLLRCAGTRSARGVL
jgi:hypothetical protein